MKVLGGLYLELIGLTHFNCSFSNCILHICTESEVILYQADWFSHWREHRLKCMCSYFFMMFAVCCCFHPEQGWNIPLLSLFLTLFCSPLLALLFFSSRKRRFLSNCNDAKGFFFQNNIEHWRTHGNHVEPYSVPFFPALVQAALPTSGVHLECKGIHM